MAFPNTLFPRIPLHTEVSDEEFRRFHTIDRMLVRKLIRSLGRNPDDAINVVAFLMWLERDRMSVNAVYKVLVDWPAHLVDMVADQIVALLEWLKNPTMVWEMRGDISMIQELCKENLAFVQLHQRRLEILQGKREIVTEMSERAFRNAFPQERNVRDEVGIGGGGVGGVGLAAGPVYGHREPVNRNINNGVQFGSVGGRWIHNSQELENIGGGFAVGVPVHVPRVHVPQTYHTYIHDPRTINPNVFRFGTVGEFVQGHGEPENINGGNIAGGFETVGGLAQGLGGPQNMNGGGSAGGSSSNNGQIIPNVPFGPRMGYVDTNGHIQRSEVNIQRPIPEEVLSFLLRGLNIQEEETDVHEDDRTVFLTFSRGYPITEPEIWGYFTRRFGNFIKGIHFEEVPEGEQPLYARMVARNTSILPLICDVHIRTKYVINGKHAWAKKYVRNNNAPPPS